MIAPSILPFDIIHLILEYDGRIKYHHKRDIFVNIIHKRDLRYNMLTPIISKKIMIITEYSKSKYYETSRFYFEVKFDIDNRVGLCYDYNYTYPNEFEICYYDMRNEWEQIRTFI
jgi:hypothetical protein